MLDNIYQVLIYLFLNYLYNMSYNQFLKDLNNNVMYENIAADKICVRNHVTLLETCNDYRYDFKSDDHITFEVKS